MVGFQLWFQLLVVIFFILIFMLFLYILFSFKHKYELEIRRGNYKKASDENKCRGSVAAKVIVP